MSYWIIVHLIVRHCLNEASIPHCRVICLHGRASTKSRTRTLEFSFMCSCCIKNSLPMWIRLSHAGLSLKMTLGVTDFFFFFSVLVQYFWHLASHSDSQRILSKFCSLERGDRAKAKALCPCIHAPLPCTHTLTHFLKSQCVRLTLKSKFIWTAWKKYERYLLLFPLGLYSQKVAGNISS